MQMWLRQAGEVTKWFLCGWHDSYIVWTPRRKGNRNRTWMELKQHVNVTPEPLEVLSSSLCIFASARLVDTWRNYWLPLRTFTLLIQSFLRRCCRPSKRVSVGSNGNSTLHCTLQIPNCHWKFYRIVDRREHLSHITSLDLHMTLDNFRATTRKVSSQTSSLRPSNFTWCFWAARPGPSRGLKAELQPGVRASPTTVLSELWQLNLKYKVEATLLRCFRLPVKQWLKWFLLRSGWAASLFQAIWLSSNIKFRQLNYQGWLNYPFWGN